MHESDIDLRALLERGPDPDSPTGHKLIAPTVRRAILRLLAHSREHQARIDRGLLAGIAATERRCQDRLNQAVEELASRMTNIEIALGDLERDLRARDPLALHNERTPGEDETLANLALHLASVLEGPSDPAHPLVDTWRESIRDRAHARHTAAIESDLPLAVRLNTDVGPMLYPSADSTVTPWVAEHGNWEPEESQLLRSVLAPGMTFIDVGAHVGYHSLNAAERIGPSGIGISLEPLPAHFTLLRANLLLGVATQVVPIPVAAWRRTELLELDLSPDNSGDHRISGHRAGPRIPVQGVAIDDIIPDELEVHVVKVDVQGRDHIVVEGMVETLYRSRPTILVEFWPEGIRDLGDDPEDVLDGYRKLELRIQVLDDLAVDGSSNAAILDTVFSRGPSAFRMLVLTPKESSGF